jgi:hypothetical protein
MSRQAYRCSRQSLPMQPRSHWVKAAHPLLSQIAAHHRGIFPAPSCIRSSSAPLRCSRSTSSRISGRVTSRRPALDFGALNRMPWACVCQCERAGANARPSWSPRQSGVTRRIFINRFEPAAGKENAGEEFRLYHRKDGRVHKEHDDLMSATRYGVMMLRFAEVANRPALDMGRRSLRAGSSNWLAI